MKDNAKNVIILILLAATWIMAANLEFKDEKPMEKTSQGQININTLIDCFRERRGKSLSVKTCYLKAKGGKNV